VKENAKLTLPMCLLSVLVVTISFSVTLGQEVKAQNQDTAGEIQQKLIEL
jgi:hypothetical protein